MVGEKAIDFSSSDLYNGERKMERILPFIAHERKKKRKRVIDLKKKTLMAIVATALFCVMLTACTPAATQTPAPTPTPTGSIPEINAGDYTFALPDAGAYDFGGRTFTIYSYHGQPFEQRTDFIRRYAQNAQIEQRFNCTIKYDLDLARGQNDALAGHPTIDFAYLMNHQLAAWVVGGIAEPLTPYADEIKFDDARWDKQVTEMATINGKVYAVAKQVEELWKYHYTVAMFMNKTLLQNCGISTQEIYAKQQNKEWTWAAFRDTAQTITRDFNHDDVPDIWGTVLGGLNMASGLMGSANTNVYVKTDKGYTFDYDNKVIDVLNFMAELYRVGAARGTESITGISSNVDSSDWLAGSIGFYPAMFASTWISFQSSMADEYGVLCMPMPDGETDYHVVDGMYASNVMFAQANKDEARKIAKFMYVYNTSLYENAEDEQEMYWLEAENRINDEGSRYFLEKCFDRANYVTLVNNAAFTNNGISLNFEEVIGGSKTAAELLQEQKPVLATLVEQMFDGVS